ncbi:MAG TPA: hypothetical protein VM618_08555, partial [Acidimicrobiia bacterium]|nr:hypothetical protein [Acidimicrobiia bacterium]
MSRKTWWWLIAVLVAAAVVGPALALGPMLSLDLVVVDRLGVPDGVFGLGGELPRAVPLWSLLAILALVTGPAAAVVMAVVAAVAGGFVGVVRRVPTGTPFLTAAFAGAAYVLSP